MRKHGISIGIERTGNQLFMSMEVKGKLTHEDYLVITPMLESALLGIEAPTISALIDCTELDGWELRAAWDDFKLGLSHGKQFKKVALIGREGWQEWATKIGNWFLSAEIAFFTNHNDSITWLKET